MISKISQCAGVECILLNKQFFVKHCPWRWLFYVLSRVEPYPLVQEVVRQLVRQKLWNHETHGPHGQTTRL
ncbi:hypothetical protein ACOMHN_048017 [Nucella lapillus]